MNPNTSSLSNIIDVLWMNQIFAYWIAEKLDLVRSYNMEIGTAFHHCIHFGKFLIFIYCIRSVIVLFAVVFATVFVFEVSSSAILQLLTQYFYCIVIFDGLCYPTIILCTHIRQTGSPTIHSMASFVNSTLSAPLRRFNRIAASEMLRKQMMELKTIAETFCSRKSVPNEIQALISDSLHSTDIQNLFAEMQAIKTLTGNSVLSSKSIAVIVSYCFERKQVVISPIDGQQMVKNVVSVSRN